MLDRSHPTLKVHIEDNTLDVAEGDEPPPPPPQATIMEAFQHFACLYIKYVQIFKRLEMCYDAMVHPQKRIDVKVHKSGLGLVFYSLYTKRIVYTLGKESARRI